MFYLVCNEKATGPRFLNPLTNSGNINSVNLSQVFGLLQIEQLYISPYTSSLQTANYFIKSKKKKGEPIRAEIHYQLSKFVCTPDDKCETRTVNELLSYGIHHQRVYGSIPCPETYIEYRQRILNWYTNECWVRFQNSPVPTAVISDENTIKIIMNYLMKRKSSQFVTDIIKSLKPGSILEFKGDGMNLEFQRIVL